MFSIQLIHLFEGPHGYIAMYWWFRFHHMNFKGTQFWEKTNFLPAQSVPVHSSTKVLGLGQNFGLGLSPSQRVKRMSAHLSEPQILFLGSPSRKTCPSSDTNMTQRSPQVALTTTNSIMVTSSFLWSEPISSFLAEKELKPGPER